MTGILRDIITESNLCYDVSVDEEIYSLYSDGTIKKISSETATCPQFFVADDETVLYWWKQTLSLLRDKGFTRFESSRLFLDPFVIIITPNRGIVAHHSDDDEVYHVIPIPNYLSDLKKNRREVLNFLDFIIEVSKVDRAIVSLKSFKYENVLCYEILAADMSIIRINAKYDRHTNSKWEILVEHENSVKSFRDSSEVLKYISSVPTFSDAIEVFYAFGKNIIIDLNSKTEDGVVRFISELDYKNSNFPVERKTISKRSVAENIQRKSLILWSWKNRHGFEYMGGWYKKGSVDLIPNVSSDPVLYFTSRDVDSFSFFVPVRVYDHEMTEKSLDGILDMFEWIRRDCQNIKGTVEYQIISRNPWVAKRT